MRSCAFHTPGTHPSDIVDRRWEMQKQWETGHVFDCFRIGSYSIYSHGRLPARPSASRPKAVRKLKRRHGHLPDGFKAHSPPVGLPPLPTRGGRKSPCTCIRLLIKNPPFRNRTPLHFGGWFYSSTVYKSVNPLVNLADRPPL